VTGKGATRPRDDLAVEVDLPSPPRRIVSLVPSLTEALAVTVPDRLIGATDWCTHPSDLDVPRVRGTKNPDVAAITRLDPDLVVANREENRRRDVERLRAAGIPVWVTVIESVDQAHASLGRLFVEALEVAEPEWLITSSRTWAEPARRAALRVVVPIWKDPWMVVGPRTFTSDLIGRLGLINLHGDAPERYPRIGLPELVAGRPDLVLLPDEPYPFTAEDGPADFPDVPTALVSGRSLTWYGPSMATARTELEGAVDAAATGERPTAG
jgi:ABC-type Fe3+-hydroxamate transport system substrate-binding protein